MLAYIIVFIVSWIIAVLGFCQIIGSIQNALFRGPGMTLFTIVVWGVILGIVCFVVHRYFPSQKIAYYAATVIGLFLSLTSGKIK